MHYNATRKDLLYSSGVLFDLIRGGKIVVNLSKTYELSDASSAHADLESRKTVGSGILKP